MAFALVLQSLRAEISYVESVLASFYLTAAYFT